jgi:hypothetical protein
MKTLRNTAEREVQEEVETLRQIRKTILEEVRSCFFFIDPPSSFHKQATATVYTPLKRKRSIEDDGTQDADIVDTTVNEESRSSHLSGRPPRHKRPRRFVSIVVQTATALTMGAVATWAALAFY